MLLSFGSKILNLYGGVDLDVEMPGRGETRRVSLRIDRSPVQLRRPKEKCNALENRRRYSFVPGMGGTPYAAVLVKDECLFSQKARGEAIVKDSQSYRAIDFGSRSDDVTK